LPHLAVLVKPIKFAEKLMQMPYYCQIAVHRQCRAVAERFNV